MKKDTLICPFCKFEAKSFLAGGLKFGVLEKYNMVGAGFRDNKECHRCSSNDRDRHLYLYLLLFTDIFSDKTKRVLHVAPEICLRNKMRKANNVEYYSIDLKERAGSEKMDICNIGFKANYFDWIICSHVLEHIDNDRLAMKEILRVLKENGRLVVTVPYSTTIKEIIEDKNVVDPRMREEKFGQKDHVRIYSEKGFIRRLEESGFSIEQFNLSEIFGEPFSKKFGLIKDEKLFACSKNNN